MARRKNALQVRKELPKDIDLQDPFAAAYAATPNPYSFDKRLLPPDARRAFEAAVKKQIKDAEKAKKDAEKAKKEAEKAKAKEKKEAEKAKAKEKKEAEKAAKEKAKEIKKRMKEEEKRRKTETKCLDKAKKAFIKRYVKTPDITGMSSDADKAKDKKLWHETLPEIMDKYNKCAFPYSAATSETRLELIREGRKYARPKAKKDKKWEKKK